VDTTAAMPAAPGIERADLARHRDRALEARAGVVVDAVADDDRVVPGQAVRVTLTAYNGSAEARTVSAELAAGRGWAARGRAGVTRPLEPGAVLRAEVTVIAPDTITRPYFTLDSGGAAMYSWRGAAVADLGEPFAAPALVARFAVAGPAGPRFRVEREVTYREVDQASGELRRPITVVPPVGVALDPPSAGTRIASGCRSPTARATPPRGRLRSWCPRGGPRPRPSLSAWRGRMSG
jgi:NPCBM-associated, NEW3 domain of alpha-galactosidase